MLHPSEYKTVPWGGLHVMVVDADTKITDERSSKEAIVDDENYVIKGSLMYCTQKLFDRLKHYIR